MFMLYVSSNKISKIFLFYYVEVSEELYSCIFTIGSSFNLDSVLFYDFLCYLHRKLYFHLVIVLLHFRGQCSLVVFHSTTDRVFASIPIVCFAHPVVSEVKREGRTPPNFFCVFYSIFQISSTFARSCLSVLLYSYWCISLWLSFPRRIVYTSMCRISLPSPRSFPCDCSMFCIGILLVIYMLSVRIGCVCDLFILIHFMSLFRVVVLLSHVLHIFLIVSLCCIHL
jgi:hypothetical protein